MIRLVLAGLLLLFCGCIAEGRVVGKHVLPGGPRLVPTAFGNPIWLDEPTTYWLELEVKVRREICVPKETYDCLGIGDTWKRAHW